MNESSQITVGKAYDLIDEDTIIEIRDHNGKEMYIDRISFVLNFNTPILSIQLLQF